jgi:RNA polymerase sigma-70 factor, ECF subfamily
MGSFDDSFGALWRQHRPYVVDLAFRMLGEIASAEDVAQEAFIRLVREGVDGVDDVRSWLTVVTGRLCLDLRRSAWVRREHPGDPVLLDSAVPQPGTDPARCGVLHDPVQATLAAALQGLNPSERVAFVLYDVFRVPVHDVAETLGRPLATCKQLVRRARQKITVPDPAGSPIAAGAHRAVLNRFIMACADGDRDGLLDVLHPDVWAPETFAGDCGPTRDLVRGADAAAANVLGHFGSDATLVSHPMPTVVGVLAYHNQAVYGMLMLTVEGPRITGIEAAVDPRV